MYNLQLPFNFLMPQSSTMLPNIEEESYHNSTNDEVMMRDPAQSWPSEIGITPIS